MNTIKTITLSIAAIALLGLATTGFAHQGWSGHMRGPGSSYGGYCADASGNDWRSGNHMSGYRGNGYGHMYGNRFEEGENTSPFYKDIRPSSRDITTR